MEEALLILLLGVTCARRQAAGHAAWPSEFLWPKTVSWNHGLTPTPGHEHAVLLSPPPSLPFIWVPFITGAPGESAAGEDVLLIL